MHYTTSGKVHTDGIIELPENWQGNIKPETISVQLTPIGTYQELYVKEIQWGMKVIIRNSGGGSLNAYYTVTADPISVTASWATEPEQLAA
jgi:hypothetical protein|tara:strand:- start:205 stop:477 length:273 start_codon:yes stop_codon:yes gene_type:complete